MSVPGIGPITAMAMQAFAPPMEGFRARGRDFAAWLGLVPRQHSTGGKPRLGKISKMGQRDLRRLLITGAMVVVRWAVRRGRTNDPWLARMLARKPRMLVAVALANRMARIVGALMTKKESYRALSTAAGICTGAAAQKCTTGSVVACPRSPWEGPARGATRPPRGWRRPARGRMEWTPPTPDAGGREG